MRHSFLAATPKSTKNDGAAPGWAQGKHQVVANRWVTRSCTHSFIHSFDSYFLSPLSNAEGFLPGQHSHPCGDSRQISTCRAREHCRL